MDFNLRCAQLMAQRADIRRLNIVERTALWYRLERIGYEPEPPESTARPVEHIHWHSAMSRKEFMLLQETANKVEYLMNKQTERETRKQVKKYIFKD